MFKPEYCVVNIVRRVTLVLTLAALSIAGSVLLLVNLGGCAAQTVESTTASFTEEEFTEDNQVFSILAEGLIGIDPVFKQALARLTIDKFHTDGGQELLPEDTVFIDTANEPILRFFDEYIETDEAYRAEAVALIFSALDMEGRQDIVNELSPNDPVLSNPEVVRLLPASNVGTA